MSYRRGLGQTKNIPGQVNFLDPWGSNPERQMNRAVRRGLPYAPYIEHGSWVTGQPDVVAWEPPAEGAGLQMFSTARGLHGLGCALARLFGGGPTAASTAVPGGAATTFASAMDAARAASGGASAPTSVVGRGVVECAGATVYTGDALTAMTYGISAARERRRACVARMTGTPQGDVTMYISAEGRASRRPPAGTSGLGQILTDFACSGSALNTSWTTRTRDTLSAAGQAAVAGGLVAGVVGALSKKPLIGAVAGAALAFGAFRVWTAPYAV